MKTKLFLLSTLLLFTLATFSQWAPSPTNPDRWVNGNQSIYLSKQQAKVAKSPVVNFRVYLVNMNTDEIASKDLFDQPIFEGQTFNEYCHSFNRAVEPVYWTKQPGHTSAMWWDLPLPERIAINQQYDIDKAQYKKDYELYKYDLRVGLQYDIYEYQGDHYQFRFAEANNPIFIEINQGVVWIYDPWVLELLFKSAAGRTYVSDNPSEKILRVYQLSKEKSNYEWIGW